MRKIDRRIVIITALVFTIGLAYGLMKFLIAQKEESVRQPKIEAQRYVRAQKVEYSTIVSPVSAPGRVSSVSQVDIVAEASGKIIVPEVPLKKGAVFSRGDVLFTIYPDEAELALKARKSQFLTSLANLLPDLRIDYPANQQQFLDFFNSISIDEPLPALPDIQDEQMHIFLASRGILSEYYSIAKDELQLQRHTIRAPFNGTYIQVLQEAGAYINTGGRVATAIRTDMLELEVPLEKFDARWVKAGDRVEVRSGDRDLTWQGNVVRKAGFVDEETQSQSIFVRIKNHNPSALLSGEYLTASFPGHPIQNAIEIPRNAIFNSNEVFLIDQGRLKKAEINIIKKNERTVIMNGVNEGEMIVTQPLINVSEGTAVDILGNNSDTNEKDLTGNKTGRENKGKN